MKQLPIKVGIIASLVVAFCLPSKAQVAFEKVGSYQASGGFDEAATEIVAYDEVTKRIFSTNGALDRIDVIDASDPSNPILIDSLAIDTIGGGINSVAVDSQRGLVVAAVQNHNKQENGYAVFFDVNGNYITKIIAGALPDMVTFNKTGSQVIVANEGEPNNDYSIDPEGSVTIINIPENVNEITQDDATQLTFHAFDAYKKQLKDAGVRIFGGTQPVGVLGWGADNNDDQDTLYIDMQTVMPKPSFKLLSSFRAGAFDEGATEIIAYDVLNEQVFSTNSDSGRVDVISIADPMNPVLVNALYVDTIGDDINSVAVYGDVVVAAVQNDDKQANGFAVFFKTDGTYITKIEAGALPDMVTFTPDGLKVLVANEGEPNDDYSVDPEGSITLINLPEDMMMLSQADAVQMDFNAFDTEKADLIDEGVRIFGGVEPQGVVEFMAGNAGDADTLVINDATNFYVGNWITLDSDKNDDDIDYVLPYQVAEVIGDTVILTTEFSYEYDSLTFVEGTDTSASASEWMVYLMDGSSSVSQDLEPEYITVNAAGDTAIVTLQENNAVAIIDIMNEEIIAVSALGVKDHSVQGNGMDASNKDDEINIANHPVLGMYMPDAITSFEKNGQTYYITANEGDAREYSALIEEVKIKDIMVDTVLFPNREFQGSKEAGSMKASILSGDYDMDGYFDEVFSYGARSFTIWSSEGDVVYDSGDDFEQITAMLYPEEFNSTNDETDFDDRSDNKGPEPEAITTGMWMGRNYAFIGLERMGGVMVYDIEDPMHPQFVDYVNSRDYNENPEMANGLAPEDIEFVSAQNSPTDKALMIVSNEVSGTIEVFEVDDENKIMEGSWVTLDSDNKDADIDYVKGYQIAEVGQGMIVLTTELDFEYDSITFVEGTDTSKAADDWTLHLMNQSSTVSQDLEPEYVAISPDNSTAVITLQENNSVAIVDLEELKITEVIALGTKDHSAMDNGFDASDRDSIRIMEHPVMGMYMPDAITSFELDGMAFYATANEGDAREYDGLIEEQKMGDIILDESKFPDADSLQEKPALGRLLTSVFNGDIDMDGDFDQLHSYGARSFSIWNDEGSLVWDSGEDFERIIAEEYPLYFNTTNDATKFDNRSDNKGPEPEAITVGLFNDTLYAFVGLERMGGIMVYQIVDPSNPEFITYINDRDYEADDELQGDMAPEDIKFVPQDNKGVAHIIVSNEVSGTVSIYTMTSDLLTGFTAIGGVNSLSAYPVPSSDEIMINVDVNGSYELTVMSVNGLVVSSSIVTEKQNIMSLGHLASGLYLVTAKTEKGTFHQKIILE